VQARLSELQTEVAKNTKLTIEDLLNDWNKRDRKQQI
jgi:hypothetical protein